MKYNTNGALIVAYTTLTAADVSIVDAGGHYVATEVEAALQELGHLTALTVAEVDQLENIGATTISAAQWGYLGASTTHPIGGDGTAGRFFRKSWAQISNGTNANTLKVELNSQWNGDTIASTDNIVKDATTGDFTLSANGALLTIEASGLSGNCLCAFGMALVNGSGTDIIFNMYASANDIRCSCTNSTTAAAEDLTALVDISAISVAMFYITDA